MIKMTEKEFKMMDLEFRTRASRLCRAKYQEVKTLLSKFIYYLEHTPILNEYIQGCDPSMTDDEIRAMTDRVLSASDWDAVTFDFGNNVREETARQYRILRYADEKEDAGRIFAIGRAFEADGHCQSSVEGFVHGEPWSKEKGKWDPINKVKVQWGSSDLYEGEDGTTGISDMFKGVRFCKQCKVVLAQCWTANVISLKKRIEANTGCSVTLTWGKGNLLDDALFK